MNVKIVTVAGQFLFWEYLFQIFGISSLQCTVLLASPGIFWIRPANILFHPRRCLHRDRYLEQQQTEKIETEVRAVERIRITD
jgi:hypothetical protein